MMSRMQPGWPAVRQRGVRRDRDEQFHDFVVSRRPRLLHTATLLTAGDTHLAEDLVQATLTKLYVAWPAFQRARKADRVLSSFAEYAIARLVTELAAAVANRPWLAEPAG